MKTICFYILLLPVIVICSCGEEKFYLPEGDQYNCVYLIQAAEQPYAPTIFMTQGEQTVNYSAFYSGLTAPGDIDITFAIANDLVAEYNEANLTEYQPMPDGSYRLETDHATIRAGESRTELMKLTLTTFGYIEAFEGYLLPLRMETDDAVVNEDLSVIYYLITASYEPGSVPCREVCADMPDTPFFSYQDKCLLAKDDNGNMLRYVYNDATEAFDQPTIVQTGWGEITHFAPGGVNTIQVLDGVVGSVGTYVSNEDGSVLPQYDDWSIIFGGLGTSYVPLGNGRHGALLMIQQGNGNLNYYGLNDTWTVYVGPQVVTEYDFRTYKTILFYDQDLIGITSTGDMWIHTYSSSDNNFSTSPSKIGSGWEDYTHVTAYKTSLLARDVSGRVWLYDFDLRGYWALKPIS